MSPTSAPWPRAVALVAFLTALAYGVWQSLRLTDGMFVYALDDAYIHMALGKNLALHGLWGCTPFHFSSSSSSLLWTALLGGSYFLTGVRDITPLLLNATLALTALVVADRYLVRQNASTGLRAIALIGIVVAAPLPGMALMGMEHILHILLTIGFAALAIDELCRPNDDPPRRSAGFYVVGTLLATSRYEGLFLIAIVGLLLLIRGRWQRAITLGVASASPTVLFGWFSTLNGWLFFPNSLMLKAGGEEASILTALFKPVGQIDLAFMFDNDQLFTLVLVGLGGALVQWLDRRTLWRPQVLAPLFLATMILLHGHYAFTSMFWEYRYAAYLEAFGVFAVAIFLSDYWPATTPVAANRVARLVAGAGMIALVWLVTDLRNGTASNLEVRTSVSTYEGHVKAAQFIQRFYPSSTVVVNDLGTVTYFTNARILDMFGLGDIEPMRIRRQHNGEYTKADVNDWTAPYQPSLAILQVGWGWVAPRIPNQWRQVADIEMPIDGEHIGFFAVDRTLAPALRKQVEEFYGPLTTQGYRLTLTNLE